MKVTLGSNLVVLVFLMAVAPLQAGAQQEQRLSSCIRSHCTPWSATPMDQLSGNFCGPRDQEAANRARQSGRVNMGDYSSGCRQCAQSHCGSEIQALLELMRQRQAQQQARQNPPQVPASAPAPVPAPVPVPVAQAPATTRPASVPVAAAPQRPTASAPSRPSASNRRRRPHHHPSHHSNHQGQPAIAAQSPAPAVPATSPVTAAREENTTQQQSGINLGSLLNGVTSQVNGVLNTGQVPPLDVIFAGLQNPDSLNPQQREQYNRFRSTSEQTLTGLTQAFTEALSGLRDGGASSGDTADRRAASENSDANVAKDEPTVAE